MDGGKKMIRLPLEYRPVKVNPDPDLWVVQEAMAHQSGMVTMISFDDRAIKSYGLPPVTEMGTIWQDIRVTCPFLVETKLLYTRYLER